MEIKAHRNIFKVNAKDRILDNGRCYALITRIVHGDKSEYSPTISKVVFRMLKKNNAIRLINEKYKANDGNLYDLYEFTEEALKEKKRWEDIRER